MVERALDAIAELLNDDYVFNTKLKVASSTEDGRTFTVCGGTNVKTGEIGGDLAVKQKLGSRTLTTKLLTSGAATTELKMSKVGLDGLKTTLLFGVGRKVGVVTLEYEQGAVATTVGADYYGKKVKSSSAVVLSSAKMRGYAVVGGEGVYDVESGTVGGVNGALSYFDGGESEMTLQVMDKGARGKLSYSHCVRDDFAVAAEMLYDREAEAALLTMGAASQLDGATCLKGKLNSNGELALSYVQEVRKSTKLTLSTKFDVKEMKAPKMGLSIAIE